MLPVFPVDTGHLLQSPVPSQYPAFPLQQQFYAPPVPAAISEPPPETAPSSTFSDGFDDFCLMPKFLADDNLPARESEGFGEVFPFLDDKW
jgi:hypothetical protein